MPPNKWLSISQKKSIIPTKLRISYSIQNAHAKHVSYASMINEADTRATQTPFHFAINVHKSLVVLFIRIFSTAKVVAPYNSLISLIANRRQKNVGKWKEMKTNINVWVRKTSWD